MAIPDARLIISAPANSITSPPAAHHELHEKLTGFNFIFTMFVSGCSMYDIEHILTIINE